MSLPPIDLLRLASRVGGWLDPAAEDADVALSCRVRLARNLDGLPFVHKLPPQQAQEVCAQLREILLELRLEGETQWAGMEAVSPLLRLVLRERHLVSRDLAPGDEGETGLPGRAVAFAPSERLSVMVNEEDHLRLQAMGRGLELEDCLRRAQELDRALEGAVSFAFTRELGYLTGCPTNVGTGIRASVMLHLPALALCKSELEKVFTAAARTGLAVRGLHGEGSRAAGDFFQVSNQVTLGQGEEQLISDLGSIVVAVVDFERQVRRTLLAEQRAALVDRVSRAMGLLRTARSMQTEVALAHMSTLRLGVALGLVDKPDAALLNELSLQVHKGHLQVLVQGEGELLDPSERDRARAQHLRRRLAQR